MAKISSKPTEILYNTCHGGFQFSVGFAKFVNEKLGSTIDESGWVFDEDKVRCDPKIIALAKEFGLDKISADGSDLRIEVVPPYCKWSIREYDGLESIMWDLPWKQLAQAFINDDEDDMVLKAAMAGKIPRLNMDKCVYHRVEKLEQKLKALTSSF